MELSGRLQAVADLVTEGLRVADIGTDHGYLPVYLLNSGKCPKVIAMDINEGPLSRAKEHIDRMVCRGKAEVRLSDGMQELRAGEVDSVVLSGMGGALMIRILERGKATVDGLRECVLQPQSEIERVRTWLLRERFVIVQENMVEEDGKYYPMMKVIPRAAACRDGISMHLDWTTAELRYGKLLLEKGHPVLQKYLLREQSLRQNLLRELKQQNERARMRSEELCQELAVIAEAISYEK